MHNIKKLISAVSLLLMLAMILASCGDAVTDVSEAISEAISEIESNVSEEESLMPIDPDLNAVPYWKDEYASEGIKSAEDVAKFTSYTNETDVKYLFEGRNTTCAVNLADGYAVTVPATGLEGDYSLSALRSKYKNDSLCLTVTFENRNPYRGENGWNTYNNEWLSRYVADDSFLSANNLLRTRPTRVFNDKVAGYEATCYYIVISDNKNIAMPYYAICVLKKPEDNINFYLLVMKSAKKMNDEFEQMISTFKPFERQGEALNTVGAYELKKPEQWSDTTSAYFDQVMQSNTVDWGFYYKNLESKRSTDYFVRGKEVDEWMDFVTGESGMAYSGQYIYSSYLHIGWQNTKHSFPKDMAIAKCGGDGVNGKPILQLSYQFTTYNNTNLNGYTPMYDILRGKYDDQFRDLAQDIKAYGAPVWFRLNNEMNSDWVSYCGMVTLLDPDIFIMTWQRLYDIFMEEGVDNCIFIFNPIAKSTPYSAWGDFLNYFPGADYCQALGLTYYEMNNEQGIPEYTFRTHYKELYETNMPYFDNYPWVIGEFGCGAGGEAKINWNTHGYDTTVLYRNADSQSNYIDFMFRDMASLKTGITDKNRYISKLKYAIWFSANDYATVNGQNKITNALNIVGNDVAIAAFKRGFAKLMEE